MIIIIVNALSFRDNRVKWFVQVVDLLLPIKHSYRQTCGIIENSVKNVLLDEFMMQAFLEDPTCRGEITQPRRNR